MIRVLTILFVLAALTGNAGAQWTGAPIDTVFAFTPGSGQNAGQGPGVFPMNVMGTPSRAARTDVPENDPRQVCSIGLNGVMTVGWKNAVVVDGPGADFTIFENAFRYGNGKLYAEPASVEVSKDGRQWVMFPFDTTTFVGCAGRTPTVGDRDPWDPSVSGGDQFDLASIGMDSVRYVRITDRTALLMRQPTNPLYDPTLTGFDLDAVLGLHTVAVAFTSTLSYDEAGRTASLTVRFDETATGPATLTAFLTDGTVVWQREFPTGSHHVDMHGLPHGCSFLVLTTDRSVETLKVLR